MSNSANRNLVAKSIEGISSYRNYVTNPYARENTSGWATYADAAGSQPVDGTGGSPNITLTRNTTTPLRLDADFLITKDAANRQGQGVSYDFTIDNADKNQNMAIVFDYSGSANFVSGLNSDVQVFIYDVTGANLLATDRASLLLGTGTYVTTFLATANTSYRLIFHIATTNANAWTVNFTGVNVATAKSVVGTNAAGPVISDWLNNLTFTTDNFGTITNSDFRYRRIGDSMEVDYNFRSGVSVAAAAAINLPSGYLIDTNKISSNTNATYVGLNFRSSTAPITIVSGDGAAVLFYDGSTNNKIFFAINTNNGTQWQKNAGTSVVDPANNQLCSGRFIVPIQSWTSNVAIANSGILRMSEILANGTRVTTTPAAIGEYRSQLRAGNTHTYSDTNGTPSPLPTAADGIKIWTPASFATADPSGQPSHYEIFVGKYKAVRPEFYPNSGRLGDINVETQFSAGTCYGLSYSYNPTTGIFSVYNYLNGTVTSTSTGISIDNQTNYQSTFFDLIVADNDFQIQLAGESAEVYVTAGNGRGSTSTTVRRFTNIRVNTGSAISYVDSATLGGVFTINVSGVYAIDYYDGTNAAALNTNFALTKNTSGAELSANPESGVPYPKLLGFMFNATSSSSASPVGFLHATINCNAGDTIRAQGSGTYVDAVDTVTWIRVTKIS